MAGKQTKNVFIETQYDNIVLVNPNELADSDGKPIPRLVDHEDMVYYANLETFIIPRTKLAIGESFDNSVVNTTIASLTNEKDLKINFLQPKGKKAFDTSWSDQLTGKESRLGKSSNQKFENLTTRNGQPTYINRTEKFEDTQLLGIKSINVTTGAQGVPKVTIEMTDIQGKMLFEQGENSMYSVFFNFPYPMFYLTLKGYYGKAIRYRLSLMSFNSRFDSNTGNFEITLELIGKFTALLMDIPMEYGRSAPKMFPTQVTIKKNSQSTETSILETTKGKIILDEVYSIYKRKKLIPENFPPHTIDSFLTAISSYETKLLKDITKGEFSVLNDVARYREILLDLKETIYTNALKNYLDSGVFYVYENKKYYPFRKAISLADREKYKTLTDDRIKYFIGELKKNKTFGENGSYKKIDGSKLSTEINVWSKIKSKSDVIKTFPLQEWFQSKTDVNNTRYYRTNEKLDLTTIEGQNKLNKFILDERSLAPGKILDLTTNQLVDEPLEMYYYGDKRFNDGVYDINSFLDIINDSLKQLEVKESLIDDDLSKILADRVVNGSDGIKGLGFKPTIRNIFAILFAGIDTFNRLMEDTHQKAWDVRNNTTRLLSVIPPEKSFSVDGLNSIQTASGQLNNQNIVYPWPSYFTKERQDNGSELYVVQYPGDEKIINQTNGWNTQIWPEVHFVEEYIKASLVKETTTNKIVYNNPKTDNTLASPNALFFPFDTLPYEDVDSVSIMYEIMERAIINSEYNKFNFDEIEKQQVDLMFAEMEGQNVVTSISSSLELQDILREYKFNYQNFLDFLKKISNSGSGKSWTNYDNNIFNTQYIVNSLNEQKEIYSIETIKPTSSLTISTDTPLAQNLKKYLESSKSSTYDLYDTFPFNNLDWMKSNLANGSSLNSKEDYYDTTKTFIYLDDKKTIARLNETETTKNIQPLTSKYGFNNSLQPYLSNVTNGVKITNRQSLSDFYTDRQQKDLYFTESYIDYGDSYSGNVGNKIQTTSLLNTPYFINALLEGVDKETNKEENAYVPLGYLYLNSLPLITTKEKLKSFDSNNVATDLDYLSATIKKYSAIHQMPYAWVLKYGSIWHRYKKFVSTGTDILDSVWKDFDYEVNYDPTTSATTKEYVIPNYTGGQETIYLQKNEQIPNVTGATVDIISTGFYPKVINQVYKYFTKKDLFTGYTQDAFFKSYNDNGLKFGKNNLSNSFLNFGFDPNNLNRSLIKTNHYQYIDAEKNSDYKGKFYMLFPSMGGIPFDQSIFETINDTNNLTKEITGNTSVYNGSVRPLWGVSQFGYFDNTLIKKPKPTEYLKIINVQTSEQNAFDLKNVTSEYSYIDEILSIFNVEMLDKFEEKFLTFCNVAPKAEELILKNEVQPPSYTEPNIIKNLANRRLYNQILQIFLIGKENVTLSDENTDGLTLGQKQIVVFAETIKKFLSFDCVVKMSNPGSFDRTLFNTFSSSLSQNNKLKFNPYVKGTLPGDGTNVTLTQSIAQNKDAWNALRTYVGFGTIDGIDYQTQTQTAFITDFFIDLGIEFTMDNVKQLAPIIKIYTTQKQETPTLSKTDFTQLIDDTLNKQQIFKEKLLNQTFTYLNKNTPKVVLQGQTQIDKSQISSDVTKLTTYNLLKGFNDKWVAGSDLKTKTIFEDFLFMDRANSDIGDTFIVDVNKVKERIEKNPKQNMMQIVSWILNDNYFQFFAMPAYINFYGIQKELSENVPKQDITIGNDLFGTHLNVDYLESSPKFLCSYIGNPSEWPKPQKDNSFVRFGDDSFDLRIPDNPLRVSDQNLDINKNNKVVGFTVDFGIQNQNIFKDLDLDMSEKKETAETFKVYADLGNSASGDKVAQQSMSMYSIYKSRSYTCGVTSLGNVMIQPTMFFALRHVPLFYGPYKIMEVTHSITETEFTTKFKGIRMTKYSLPKIDNLVASVNKNVLKSFKETQQKTMPNIETSDEKTLEIDPQPSVQSAEIECSGKTVLNVGYTALKPTKITSNELLGVVKEKTTSKTLIGIIMGVASTRGTNTINDGFIQSNNCNVYGIFTDTTYGSLNSKITTQTCANVNGVTRPMADFDTYSLSTDFIFSYFKNIEQSVIELNKINVNIDVNRSFAESITQLIYTSWDTKKAFINNSDGSRPTIQQIKDMTITDKNNGTFPTYDEYVRIIYDIYTKI